MKNFCKYISIIAVMGAFASCDPITDTYTIDDSTIPADELQLSVAPKVVDGKNGNIIVVENNSPILSEWSVGESVARKACRTFGIFHRAAYRQLPWIEFGWKGIHRDLVYRKGRYHLDDSGQYSHPAVHRSGGGPHLLWHNYRPGKD